MTRPASPKRTASRPSSAASGGRVAPSSHAPPASSGLRQEHLPPQSAAADDQDSGEYRGAASQALGQVEMSAGNLEDHEGIEDLLHATETDHLIRTSRNVSRTWDQASGCGSDECQHGTFSPRPETRTSIRSYGSFASESSRNPSSSREWDNIDAAGGAPSDGRGRSGTATGDKLRRKIFGGRFLQKKKTTHNIARERGVRSVNIMYLSYYFPFLNWITQYKRQYLRGDLVAAITMASFYIPMSLSLASNLGHIPPINGMYSFVFNPLVYALLGTCPQMVVGPEAAGSLLTGTVVKENIERGHSREWEDREHAVVAGVVTTTAGAFIFLAGMTRLGFLDSVLSRPFLRGFISAIGIVIFVDQLIPELGLGVIAKEVGGVTHGSVMEKIQFIITHIRQANGLTSAVSLGAFAIIMICRETKSRLQSRYPSVVFIPDRFLVVVLSAIFAWHFRWGERGLDILGDIRTGGRLFEVHLPFHGDHLTHVSYAISTSFIIALLGFFESSVAAKSLGTTESQPDGLRNINLSPNRELVALGVANLVGGTFMALPAFGGYGRSKVNASTGGRTPMSSIFLSLITLISCFALLPYFYYLPRGVLSSMISVVAYSLMEEAPHDIRFFWKIRGYSELTLMFIIFATTVLWDLKTGVAVGMGLSILRVIRHSTRPRIQILGRVPGTNDFKNAELYASPDEQPLEFIDGCLIVKIPEPLTFANTGDLQSRLRRLEQHGTDMAHPALPQPPDNDRAASKKNIIFDVHGVTSLDGAGTQVLYDIVDSYVRRGVRVFFCRVPGPKSSVWRLFESSGIVERCGGKGNFVSAVDEALRLAEAEAGSV